MKKRWKLYSFLLILCAAFLFGAAYISNDTRQFNKLTRELFQNDLSNDTLSLHYTLAYPEKYGINANACLPVYDGTLTQEAELSEIQTTLNSLSHISPNRLNEQDAYTYDLLTRYLQRRLKGAAFSHYSDPLAPSSGMQSGLPILLADYSFRRVSDIENYLALLEQTSVYFEGLVNFETEKAAQGLFMPAYSAAKVIEQCDSIMNMKELEQGTHFLHTTFLERLKPLIENGSLSSEDAKKFVLENDRLLTTVMQPAYEQTADSMTVLEDKGVNPMGLFYFPNGKDYYAYWLSLSTGSDRSIAEMKELLFEDYQTNYQALLSLLQKHPEFATNYVPLTPDFWPDTPAAMLENLQAQMSKDFPSFPTSSKTFQPTCTVKTVSSSMEDYCSPAYYLTPPIDDMNQNVIYINQKSSPDSLTLYTTLAHEGYPGHLYQTVYSQLYMNSHQVNPIRNLLHYGGYVEGWALYVENLSYLYAQEQVKETHPTTAAYYECCRLNRNLHLCLYSLLDIAIHYEGATPEQVWKILSNLGVTDAALVQGIYEYIVESPANYPKYYFGYLEFQLLKKEAQKIWASEFTDYKFHKFVLETGPSDFIGLHEQLKSVGNFSK